MLGQTPFYTLNETKDGGLMGRSSAFFFLICFLGAYLSSSSVLSSRGCRLQWAYTRTNISKVLKVPNPCTNYLPTCIHTFIHVYILYLHTYLPHPLPTGSIRIVRLSRSATGAATHHLPFHHHPHVPRRSPSVDRWPCSETLVGEGTWTHDPRIPPGLSHPHLQWEWIPSRC